MNRTAAIQQYLTAALAPSYLVVHDESHLHVGHTGHGGAGHFRIEIASERFKGLTLIEQHRLVYQALAPLMPAEIHALAIHISVANDYE